MKVLLIKKFQKWYTKFQISTSPQMNLVWGFFLYTLAGFVLLSLPIFHKVDIPLLDNFFISTSAISTTGLITISLADSYNFFGQFIIMLLIQIGGIGYMTLTTYYIMFTTRKITNWHKKIIGAEFTMPSTIKTNDFLKSVIIFTLVMETLGAICFFIAFKGNGMHSLQAIWYSIFHSVSTFCTAGFALFNDSFMSYQNDVFVNLIISVLAISGSLGFIVVTDIWYKLTGKCKSISFTSKIIIYGFLLLLFFGTIITYVTEPHITEHAQHPLMKSFFQTMSAMTTVGFNTIDMVHLSLPTLLLVTFLMYIGASPSGTAGGMKITTVTTVAAVLKSRILGQKKITFLSRRIPIGRLYVATSTFILYTSLIFLFTFLMAYTEKSSFENILFEVASALGTVGLSTGLTPHLSTLGKIFIIILMFVGRVGVLTFGFALLAKRLGKEIKPIQEDVAV